MKIPSSTLLSAAILLGAIAPDAPAQLIFNDGGVHVVDTTVNDFIYVRDGAGHAPTTVTFNPGADITGSNFFFESLAAFRHSVVSIEGGVFAEDISGVHKAQINMSAGEVGYDVWMYNKSNFNMTGGTVGHNVEAVQKSTVTIHDGSIGEDLHAHDRSSITVFGGIVINDVEAWERSHISIFGGTVGDDLISDNRSSITVFNGIVIDDVEAYGRSYITLLGGSFGEDIEVSNRATIDISGGLFAANGVGNLDTGFSAANRGTIILRGTEFLIDGVAVGLGTTDIASFGGKLSGTLLDGSMFADIDFERLSANSTIRLIVVPEPATYGLIGALCLIGLAASRRLKARLA